MGQLRDLFFTCSGSMIRSGSVLSHSAPATDECGRTKTDSSHETKTSGVIPGRESLCFCRRYDGHTLEDTDVTLTAKVPERDLDGQRKRGNCGGARSAGSARQKATSRTKSIS